MIIPFRCCCSVVLSATTYQRFKFKSLKLDGDDVTDSSGVFVKIQIPRLNHVLSDNTTVSSNTLGITIT